MKFFATAAKGTEPALRDELRELRFASVRADRGGVHFEGPVSEGYRACLWSRIALRVLTPLATFDAPDEDLCQLTKDAVVDRIRARHGARPSVEKRDPDVHLFLHLVKDSATLYLDFAGTSLHERGFRARAAEAPLRETLAAALLRYSGWDRDRPCFDPACGSGTLLVEAGLWAKNLAPGLAREQFGFERWAGFSAEDRATLADLRADARAAVRPTLPPLVGSDVSESALALARHSAARAGVPVELNAVPLREAQLTEAGAVVVNPPYGKRLERPADLGRELARLVDRHADSAVALLMAEGQPIGRTRRRPEPLRSVYNGDIACVVRTWSVSRRDARER